MLHVIKPVDPDLLIEANKVIAKEKGKGDPTVTIVMNFAGTHDSDELLALSYRLQALAKLIVEGHGPAARPQPRHHDLSERYAHQQHRHRHEPTSNRHHRLRRHRPIRPHLHPHHHPARHNNRRRHYVRRTAIPSQLVDV